MKEEKIAAVILTMRRGFWKGGLWSLVSILFVPSRKIGKGAAGGHKASVGLKLRCLLL